MNFYTSDLHLGDERRGRREKGEVVKIVKRICEPLREGDRLYILGDLAEDKDTLFLALELLRELALKGRFTVTLITGNNDRKFFKLILKNFCPPFEGVKWFYLRTMYVERLGGKKLTLSHYPLLSFDDSHYNAYHLHGHLHVEGAVGPEGPVEGKRLNVNMDLNRGYPYSEDEILKLMEGKGDNWDYIDEK